MRSAASVAHCAVREPYRKAPGSGMQLSISAAPSMQSPRRPGSCGPERRRRPCSSSRVPVSCAGETQRGGRGYVAGSHARSQVAQAGDPRAVQQDGSRRLGADDARRGLLSSVCDRLSGPPMRGRHDVRGEGRGYGATLLRRDQENQPHG